MPRTRSGRPFPTHTKLGRLMLEEGINGKQLCAATGIYPRSLTELLSGRKPPTARMLVALTTYFECEPEDILEHRYPFLADDDDAVVERMVLETGHDIRIEKAS